MAVVGCNGSSDADMRHSGASSLIGNLIAILIVVLIAGVVFSYFLGFHMAEKPDITAYSPTAQNASALKITCLAGDSIYKGSLSILLDDKKITNYVLGDSNKDSRWDPGEIVYLTGVDISTPRKLTITSSSYVLYTGMVQYLGQANNSTSTAPTYASGLMATYYSDESWTTRAATRIARSIQYADDGSIGTYPSRESHWPTAELGKTEYFSVDFSGLVKIDTEADYTFYLTSDDGSYLVINGTRVIDNGGLHSPQMRQATIHLTPGYLDIDVKMFQHSGRAVAILEYSSPTMSRQYVTALYHIPSDKPTADFTGSPRGAPAPVQVRFTDLSMGATAWQWDFGDGSTSTDQNPVHTYARDGAYTVTLIAKNTKGSDTKTAQDYIITGTGSQGFRATYYADEIWTTPAGSETLSQIRLADPSGISAGYASDKANWPTYLIGRSEQFSASFTGSLNIGSEADYTFYLTSDDGSTLTIDGQTIVDNSGLHSPAEKQGTVHLTPGYHDMEVKMYEHTGQAVARLEYSSPTMARKYVQDVFHM